MKIAALISGGKDSCYNIMRCVQEGHEIVALINLYPQTKGEKDSYMYQTTGQEIIPLYAKATGITLYRKCISGQPNNISGDYEATNNDEVEDLYEIVKEVKEKQGIEGLSVGAIFSEYQANRVTNICKRLGLEMLAFLWQRDQKELLDEMIEAGVEAVLVKVASLGLAESHLGLTLQEAKPHLLKLHEKYGSNICGEGGEFETIVLNCPIFKKKIVIKEKEVIKHSNDVWYLSITDADLVDK